MASICRVTWLRPGLSESARPSLGHVSLVQSDTSVLANAVSVLGGHTTLRTRNLEIGGTVDREDASWGGSHHANQSHLKWNLSVTLAEETDLLQGG